MSTQMIGRYEVLSELGRGGMATVFRAYDPRFRREVAIKTLPREFLHDPSFRGRFEREAQTIAALEHPAIVPVYDFGEENGQPYIVMRLMTGGTLADRMRAGALPLSDIIRIYQRLAAALDEAHTRGVIHRDLKPGNILFDNRGEPYLSDFGIAKLSESNSTLTGAGIIGTPAYMSPEQARGDRNIDGRSDVYALGAILFQLLTDKPPYEADTPMGVVTKHITEPVPSLRAVKPDWPDGFETLIKRAMAKDREARFATAAELSEALTAAADKRLQPIGLARPVTGPLGAAGAAASDAGPTMVTGSSPLRNNARLWQIGTFLFGGIVLLVVGIFVVIGLINSTPEEPTPTSTTKAEATATELVATEGPTAIVLPATVTLSAIAPTDTETPAPTLTPLGRGAAINSIEIQDGVYVVEYSVRGYEQGLPGEHVHFFFDTVPPEQAGQPGTGPWALYGGPSPYRGFKVSSRPAGANRLCILVANRDHSVEQNTGNCVALP